MLQLGPFLAGATTAAFVIAAAFFLRFWVRTRESLFAAFSLAFFLLALNQAVVSLGAIPLEYRSWAYLLRAAAFLVLIVAIVRKNLDRKY